MIDLSQMSGHLDIIYGPMYAGKSTELCGFYKRVKAVSKSSDEILVLNSSIDVRSSPNSVQTHNMEAVPAMTVASLMPVLDDPKYKTARFILIDECQFFSDLKEFVNKALFQDKKHVVVSGLIADYRSEKFGQLLELFPHANSITQKTAYCMLCNNYEPALYSKKISTNTSQVDVGGTDKYVAVCRTCYSK